MSDDTTTSSGGPEHDAWLREALRHAPDATAAPPISLREAILAEARAATRAVPRNAPTISLADRFAAFWSWLARPPIAAGFASVMAATLVGLMWWDRPIDEAIPQASAPVVAAAAPKTEADQQSPVSATPAPLAGPATAAQSTTTPAATPPVPAAATDRAQRRAVAPPQAAPAEPVAALPAKTVADALREESKDAAKTQSNAAPAAPAAQAPPAAPSPFPMPDLRDNDARAVPGRAEPTALAKKAEKSDAEEKKEVAASENRLAAAAPATVGAAPTGALGRSIDASTDAGATGRFAAQTQPAAAIRQRAAEATAATRPMAPLLAALTSETGRWSRPGPTGGSAAVDDVVLAWLARVDAAATQWQPLVDRASRLDGALASTAEASTVLLYRDGRSSATVRIEDAGVFFEARPGQAWFAPLSPEVVARLRATLPPTTR